MEMSKYTSWKVIFDKGETIQLLEIRLREKSVINKPTAGNKLNPRSVKKIIFAIGAQKKPNSILSQLFLRKVRK